MKKKEIIDNFQNFCYGMLVGVAAPFIIIGALVYFGFFYLLVVRFDL